MEESHPAHLHLPHQISRQPLPQMQNISTPLQWAYCMFTYIAVACDDDRIREMLTYAHIVLHLTQKHGGAGWLEYNQTFRQQAASDSTTKWNAVNPSLMASSARPRLIRFSYINLLSPLSGGGPQSPGLCHVDSRPIP